MQVPDPDPGFLPAADRQPAAIRADGDRGHAAILAAVEGRRPAPGRVGMARIDEQDTGVGVVDQRQSPMIGQPGRFAANVPAGSLQQLGWTDADRVRSALGIGPDRPAIQAPLARADQALPVGVKQHGVAATGLEVGQLAARVGLPEADAVPVAGRQQPAVGADIRRGAPRWRPAPRSGCRASPGGASGTPRPMATSQTPIFPPHIEGQPAVVRRERPASHPARSPGAPPRRRPRAGSCRPSSRSPAGNPSARTGRR